MKRMIRRKFSMGLAVFVIIGVVGFAGAAQAASLNFALSGNPDTLDPHKTSGTLTFQTIKSIYDTLAEPDVDGKLIPALAEKWDVSADGLTWTFTLRKGVVFHIDVPISGTHHASDLHKITTEKPKQVDHVNALVEQNSATGNGAIAAPRLFEIVAARLAVNTAH